jgi:hypothetical protein
MKPLTEQQRRRLVIAVYFGVTASVERSMPSLERRGLMARERRTEHGVSHVWWVPTEAGRREAERIRASRVAS